MRIESQFKGGEIVARQFDMCDVCKLDKAGICDYNCIKKRSDFMFRFFTCPNFIYDDKQSITNAELLSTDIKNDVDAVATQLWDKLVTKNDFATCGEFAKWLKIKAFDY